jgi:hypothetical protein
MYNPLLATRQETLGKAGKGAPLKRLGSEMGFCLIRIASTKQDTGSDRVTKTRKRGLVRTDTWADYVTVCSVGQVSQYAASLCAPLVDTR